MRGMFGPLLIAALASASAALAQPDPKAQEQEDQQRTWEQHRNDPAPGQAYNARAADALRQAERAKTPAEKAAWIKMAQLYEGMARNTAPPPR